MQTGDLVSDITRRLANADSLDEIITDVCQRTRYPWPEAEALVLRIQRERDEEILRHRRPLMTILALAIFTGGVVALGYGLFSIIESIITHRPMFPDDITTYLAPVIESGADPLDSLQAILYPYARMIAEFLFSPFSALLLGFSMVFGSLSGMQDTWRSFINRLLEARHAR